MATARSPRPPAAARKPSPVPGCAPAPAVSPSTAAPFEDVLPDRRRTGWSSPSRCASPRPPSATTSTPRSTAAASAARPARCAWRIARALVELDPESRPALKKAGLLTRDARKKESKKYGLKKARKAPQYTKR